MNIIIWVKTSGILYDRDWNRHQKDDQFISDIPFIAWQILIRLANSMKKLVNIDFFYKEAYLERFNVIFECFSHTCIFLKRCIFSYLKKKCQNSSDSDRKTENMLSLTEGSS